MAKHPKSVSQQAVELSDRVLAEVEARQRSAIAALRTFIDHLDDVVPNLVDDPSARKKVVEAIGDYYEQLATAANEFVTKVVHSTVGTSAGKTGTKED
jgi:uncharacterized membrane-anchored protein YjiN (DUF445 family)